MTLLHQAVMVLILLDLTARLLTILNPEQSNKFLEESSTIYCKSNNPSAGCRIRNLVVYLDEDGRVFGQLFKIHNASVDASSLKFDLSGVKGHGSFQMHWRRLEKISISTVIEEPVQLASRFYASNIMHVIHDDVLGLMDRQDQWPHLHQKASTMIFVDPYDQEMPYDDVYAALYDKVLVLKKKNNAILLRDVVIGISHQTQWYQYGLVDEQFQGPVARLPDSYRLQSLKSKLAGVLGASKASKNRIVICVRSRNRRILNWRELQMALEAKGFIVEILDLDQISVMKAVWMVSRSSVLIGMHGAALILGMFLGKHGRLIEIFPYALDPMSYTPYRTMAVLFDLWYVSIATTDRSKTVAFADRPRHLGGIRHLSLSEQQMIERAAYVPTPHKCCMDAHFLYRMYQDTIVDVSLILQYALGKP